MQLHVLHGSETDGDFDPVQNSLTDICDENWMILLRGTAQISSILFM
jgi:hypothetical protein